MVLGLEQAASVQSELGGNFPLDDAVLEGLLVNNRASYGIDKLCSIAFRDESHLG